MDEDKYNKVTRLRFPFEYKKWKRYPKDKKRQREGLSAEQPKSSSESRELDELGQKQILHPEELTPQERRHIIVRYLARALLRLIDVRRKKGG